MGGNAYLARSLQRAQRSSGRRTVAVLVWYCNHTNFLHRNDGASSFGRCGRPESYLHCITYLVSYFVLHTGLVSSFGGCMAQASYFDTARRPVSFLAKKARFVTTSNLRSCHKAICFVPACTSTPCPAPRATAIASWGESDSLPRVSGGEFAAARRLCSRAHAEGGSSW